MGEIGCNVEKALNIIGGKWTTLIVRDLLDGPRRFTELRKSLHDISPKSLTTRLKNLEHHSVISRTVFAEIPPRVEYSLTEYGRKLQGVIGALEEWGRIEPPKVSVISKES